MRHFHDGLFCRSEVVTQVDQRRTDVGKLALAGTHDVCKLRDGRRGVAGVQVFAGIAEVKRLGRASAAHMHSTNGEK